MQHKLDKWIKRRIIYIYNYNVIEHTCMFLDNYIQSQFQHNYVVSTIMSHLKMVYSLNCHVNESYILSYKSNSHAAKSRAMRADLSTSLQRRAKKKKKKI